MFGGEKVCEFLFLFFRFVCFFLGGGGRDGLIIVQKKGNFVYYLKKLLSTRHCNTLHCFIIVIFVQWVLVQLLNFRLSLRKRRWQKWKALAAQVISVTNFQPAFTRNLFPLTRLLLIPLTKQNQVWGPYYKLWIKFFQLWFMACMFCAWAINQRRKKEAPSLTVWN